MKSHIVNDEFNKAVEKALKENFEKVRLAGLSVGCKSVSKVIYDKAIKATPETAMSVIADIIKFCEVGLAIKDKEEDT